MKNSVAKINRNTINKNSIHRQQTLLAGVAKSLVSKLSGKSLSQDT